jgi:hypothetical protein
MGWFLERCAEIMTGIIRQLMRQNTLKRLMDLKTYFFDDSTIRCNSAKSEQEEGKKKEEH